MPKEVLNQYLELRGEQKKRLQFILQSAPLLKGVKMSCILVVEAEYLDLIREELKDTNISLQILSSKTGKYTILLYRENVLKHYLNQKHVADFLKKYGYCAENNDPMHLSDILYLLGKRVTYFNKKMSAFPHEIGVFLGYPLSDIAEFINNAGENYLLNGYWKVYSNTQEAKKRFQLFDDAKLLAVQELLAGMTIKEITKEKEK